MLLCVYTCGCLSTWVFLFVHLCDCMFARVFMCMCGCVCGCVPVLRFVGKLATPVDTSGWTPAVQRTQRRPIEHTSRRFLTIAQLQHLGILSEASGLYVASRLPGAQCFLQILRASRGGREQHTLLRSVASPYSKQMRAPCVGACAQPSLRCVNYCCTA